MPAILARGGIWLLQALGVGALLDRAVHAVASDGANPDQARGALGSAAAVVGVLGAVAGAAAVIVVSKSKRRGLR